MRDEKTCLKTVQLDISQKLNTIQLIIFLYL